MKCTMRSSVFDASRVREVGRRAGRFRKDSALRGLMNTDEVSRSRLLCSESWNRSHCERETFRNSDSDAASGMEAALHMKTKPF